MSDENETTTTIHLIVRNETFELSSSLFHQLVESSSSSDLFVFTSENENQMYLDVDPLIFNAYLIYIQSGYFIRPDYLSQEDLINGLRQCHVPLTLINHYESCDLTSVLSSHPYSSHPINKINKIQHKWSNSLVLTGLFIAACILSIDLYRQILILNKNPYQETSPLLIAIVYSIDGMLFLYSCRHGISKFISSARELNRLRIRKDLDIIVDLISCLGILFYFTLQRPITHVYLTPWNFLWILIHICRTIRLAQIGYRLLDIQWCLYAISQCLWTFLQTITGLFWIFIFSGSMLYTMDIIEDNQQYSNMRLTILSAHETLYTIGYRNNAPYGCLTRLWTITSIYFMSSLVQIFIWWFQTKVTIKWKSLLDKKKQLEM
jgi:hypothetical protein